MDVGIECYASTGDPCAAVARSRLEDFVVEERAPTEGVAREPLSGYLPLYRVEKRSIDTLHMAEELSKALRSRVSFAGMKDKRARAVQYVTPTSLRSDRPPEVVRERFRAVLVGFVPRPLSRGSSGGNSFEVVLRDCCDKVAERSEEALSLAEQRKVPNFYGLQRFGASGAGTHRIGKAIVERKFEVAVRTMLFRERPSDGESVLAAREAMESGEFEKGAQLLPAGLDIEKMVARELSKHPGDWVKALRRVPLKLRRLYVQAYQSVLFNRTLSRTMARGEDISALKPGDNWAQPSSDGLMTGRPRGVRDLPTPGAVPMVQLVGFAYRDYGSRFDAAIKETLAREGVTPGQFFVEEMQEVSNEGGFRRPHLAVRDASSVIEGGVARLRFSLGSGQYATVLLREIVKPRNPWSSGLA